MPKKFRLEYELKLAFTLLLMCCFCSCGIKGKPLPPIDNELATPAVSSTPKIKNGN